MSDGNAMSANLLYRLGLWFSHSLATIQALRIHPLT